jgi:hypothetical protein
MDQNMENLKSILNRYTSKGISLGDKDSEPLKEDILRKDLEVLRTSHKRRFGILFAIVVITYFGLLGIIFLHLRDPRSIAALFGAIGVTLASLIAYMRRLWKEQFAAELTLALLGNMQPQTLKATLEIMIKKL